MNKDRLFMSCLGMIIGIILGVVAGQCIAAKKYIKCIEAYDAFDPQSYYDSKAKLDSLMNN